MSNTPSLVDVYYHCANSRPHAGVFRVFVDGFGRDLEFRERPACDGELEIAFRSIELDSAHLAAVLSALREEQSRLERDHRDKATMQASSNGSPIRRQPRDTRTVELIRHTTLSGLSSGVLRIHRGPFSEDLPWHEHVSRSGRMVVQLHELQADVALLEASCEALARAEDPAP